MDNILELFGNSVRKYPDKIAVAMRGDNYTFSQLMIHARCLAKKIPSNIQRRPIVVLVNRDIDVVVLILAAIYSGNYYVPVDINMPLEKICAIIDDASPEIILGDQDNFSVIERTGFKGIFLTFNDMGNELCEVPKIKREDPLYMVYTSGSTGKPKGVLKSHGAIISFIEAYCETFEFTEEDVIGNQTPFYFDASAKDLYLAFKTGATLDLIPTELFALPPMLIEYLNDKKISFISWVPTALSIVVQLNTFTYIVPKFLKKVFFVGEVMPIKYLNKWRDILPNVQFVNLYGSSEVAGISCYYEVKEKFDDADVLPMGKTLKNCKIYLVNENGVVSSTNVIGEVYVVSDSLAIEYYHDMEKTAISFLQKDFGEGTVRCFKTGDLAQYDDNGNLIFVSRVDYQIKHRGHRIELGEIETVANSMQFIHRACCVYDNSKMKIVLFCELTEECEETKNSQILNYLRSRLSGYMIPNRIIVMEKLPINANGKIDRQVLKTYL